MAESNGTGSAIVLTGTALRFGAEFLHDKDVASLNWSVVVAGLFSAILVNGLQKADPKIGIGFAWIVFIGMVTIPIAGSTTPLALVDQDALFVNAKSKQAAPARAV